MREGITTLLLDSGLPTSYWGEALHHLCYVRNRILHRTLEGGKTPRRSGPARRLTSPW